MVCQETLLQYEESAEALETWCHNITPFDFRHLSTGFGIKAFASESLPPAGREQSENHDQCIGTFGQSRSPDSRGCLGVWLAVDGPGWLIYHDISCPPDATNI